VAGLWCWRYKNKSCHSLGQPCIVSYWASHLFFVYGLRLRRSSQWIRVYSGCSIALPTDSYRSVVRLDDGVFTGVTSGNVSSFLGIPFVLPVYVPHLFCSHWPSLTIKTESGSGAQNRSSPTAEHTMRRIMVLSVISSLLT
jgi:hypothetical protein